MSNDFLPSTPLQLALWFGNAATVANANLTAMGVVAADVTALNGAKTNLDAANTTVESAKEAYRAAVLARKNTQKASVATARAFSKKVQGNPSCPANLKKQAGLNVRATSAKKVVPVTPTKLVATGYDNGTTLLTWLTAGNKAGTVYQIEAQAAGETDFQIVGVTTKSRHTLTAQTPGEAVAFRVCAVRTDLMSGYSNVAVVYANSGAPNLQLLKAA